MNPVDSLENELKQLIVTTLRLEGIRPEDIGSELPLFNEGLGLDSIDGLELSISLSKTYKIELSQNPEENKQYFANIKNLVSFIRQKILEKQECCQVIAKEDIFVKVKKVLMEVFELEESLIIPSAYLYSDLGLDSFDAIDLAVKFGADIGIKLKEEDLRPIRTISDIVEVAYKKLNADNFLED